MDNLKPSTKEIEDYLSSLNLPKEISKDIANIVVKHSKFDKNKENLLIDKKKLKYFLNENIVGLLPEKLKVKVDKTYLLRRAIEKSKDEVVSLMDEIIDNIKLISQKEINEEEKINQIIDYIVNNDKLDLNLKENILNNFKKLNQKIQILNQNLNLATEKFYKDTLTGLLGESFYKEFISNNVKFKRKKDEEIIDLYRAFIKSLEKIDNKAVMFIDFANFKVLNDILGHDRADEILKDFAKYLRKNKSIVPIRRSGDEFILIGSKEELEKIKKEILSSTFVKKMNNLEKYPELKEAGIITFPSAGIEELKEFDLIKAEDIKSLRDINSLKDLFSNIIKNAEEKCEEIKVKIKQKFNQPLSRKEAEDKINYLDKVKELKNNIKIKEMFVKDIDKTSPKEPKKYFEWLKTNPYSDEKFEEWLIEKLKNKEIDLKKIKEPIINTRKGVKNENF